jgi:phosphonate transport system permease protein
LTVPDSSELQAVGKPPEHWGLKPPFTARTVFFVLIVFVLFAWSFKRTELDRAVTLTAEGAADLVGLKDDSDVGRGASRLAENSFPMVFARETPVNRIEDFDRNDLPWFAYVETRTTVSKLYDYDTLELKEIKETEEFMVEPVGYLLFVGEKMLESLEMAVWGTLLAILLGVPLAYFGARNYTPHPVLYWISRTISSFNRAVPELVSALFLVLMYGFGPIAGVLALGFHCSGFFGKFFADDVENADKGPQEALQAAGAGKVKTLYYAVLPQVMPQYIAYTQYILERNVRMATVIGIVGAGGIGIELKGRFDMFNFGHVTTILFAIFLTVLLLERISQAIRKKII